jgi:predicted nucleic acid-binding protein
MYLVGQSHPNRDRLRSFLGSQLDEPYVTSAEVYQEVVHRYVAIDRRQAIKDCFDLLDNLVHNVYPITREDTERAAAISLSQRRLSGRDCLHIAVMERYGVKRVLTCDEDFDLWAGLIRLP